MTGPDDGAAPRRKRGRAIAVVVAGLPATGVLVGGLWAWIAPAIHGAVALTRDGDRVFDYLGSESEQFFVAAVVMMGLSNVLAAVAAALVWQWRAHRGPYMVAGLCVGMILAAAAAAGVGALLVHLRYGALDIATAPVTPQNQVYYVTEAPPVFFGHTPLQIACTLLLPAATAALVYAVPAAAAVRDDLGGYPAVDSPALPAAVTAGSS
ncbi:DUF2567 domain-containing protein [Mycobacterium sp.]|uniref:DUF2567 domain-containing protein n=1 Tax=Mycobacterium sp. TaxID=1785 RepID=UPI0031D4BFE5